MSQFNIYARKLDTVFKEARSEYNTAFRALQEAQQASRDANAWKPGDSAEEKQVSPMPTTVPTPGVTIEPITAPSSAHSTTINSERSCDLPPCSSSPSAKPVR